MITVTDQFPGVTVIVRSAALARYCGFEMSLEALHVPLKTHVARAISANLAGTPNQIIKESDAPFIWFMDDDHSFDYYHLLRLMAHDLPIVQAMTCMNKPPFHPVIYSGEVEWGAEQFPDLDKALDDINGALDGRTHAESVEAQKEVLRALFRRREFKPLKKKFMSIPWSALDKEAGLKEVPFCGLSGMLIKREVFEKMEYPWFELGQTNPEEVAEDVYFCSKATKAGYKIIVDLGLAFGHFAPCAAWPCRLDDGSWTIRLTWENGQSIVINRPDKIATPIPIPVDEKKVADLGDKGQRIVQRTKELVAGGMTEAEAFTKAMNEAESVQDSKVIELSERRK